MGSNHRFVVNNTLQPVIFSGLLFTGSAPAPAAAELEDNLYNALLQVQETLQYGNALIGHIKLLAEDKAEREYLWLSTTGKAINTRRSAGWSNLAANLYRVNLTVIVFNANPEELKQMVLECFARVASVRTKSAADKA